MSDHFFKSGQKSKKLVALSILTTAFCVAAAGLGTLSACSCSKSTPPAQTDTNTATSQLSVESSLQQDGQDDEEHVRAVVEAFGKALQMVSLSAPDDAVAASIEQNYSSYVTPDLLHQWKTSPQSAPGRAVSSPWPDRIDILSLEQNSATEYTVHGEIIEVTSVELANGGAAAKRPITLTVQKLNGRWLISGATLGAYAQNSAVVYKNTQYGFDFYLPESWKGYTIVEEQWQGTPISEAATAQTGPQLLIRHPGWTKENPRQDIPIMVFTLAQWDAVQKEQLSVSAAPIGPSRLGSNSQYVFALPARYNFAFPTGFEEVEEIMKGTPLSPMEEIGK